MDIATRRGPRSSLCPSEAARMVDTADWRRLMEPARRAARRLAARGPVTLHADDDLAQAQWEASQPGSRRCYLSAGGPGSALDAPGSGLPESLLDRRPSEAESAPGRVHFAVLACELTELDWLALDSRGHRRARFRWDHGAWQHAWITP